MPLWAWHLLLRMRGHYYDDIRLRASVREEDTTDAIAKAQAARAIAAKVLKVETKSYRSKG